MYVTLDYCITGYYNFTTIFTFLLYGFYNNVACGMEILNLRTGEGNGTSCIVTDSLRGK
jgi:hypothetical protein